MVCFVSFWLMLILNLSSYITMPIFTLMPILSCTVGVKLQLSVKKQSQRWELMGRWLRIAYMLAWLPRPLRDMFPLLLKKGGLSAINGLLMWKVLPAYWRGRSLKAGESGVCYATTSQVTHHYQHERDKQTHWGTLHTSHSIHPSLIPPPPSLLSSPSCFLQQTYILFCFSAQSQYFLTFVLPSSLIAPISSFFFNITNLVFPSPSSFHDFLQPVKRIFTFRHVLTPG